MNILTLAADTGTNNVDNAIFGLVGYVLGLVVVLAITYFVIKSAVLAALNEHRIWLEARLEQQKFKKELAAAGKVDTKDEHRKAIAAANAGGPAIVPKGSI
jgi:hypothetical protein